MYQELEAAYKEMAQDKEREAKVLEWAEATVGDVSDAVLSDRRRGGLARPELLVIFRQESRGSRES